jgi:hypothetical protein
MCCQVKKREFAILFVASQQDGMIIKAASFEKRES